tara:strand:+ start:10967 stop:11266 length:300 start_codon:yes stop_codon:yes gene_type:complete
MANLQSMTLTQRMNTLNGDGIWEYTFQEACNIYVKENISGYSGIGINDYTPEEAFAIIRDKADKRSHSLEELINDMGSYGLHDYTSTESLNKQASITEG